MKASAKDVEEDTFRSLVKVQQKVPEGLDVGRVLQQQIAHLDIGKTICILYLCVCQCMAYHTMPCHPCTGRERESDRERERRDRKRERERERERESLYRHGEKVSPPGSHHSGHFSATAKTPAPDALGSSGRAECLEVPRTMAKPFFPIDPVISINSLNQTLKTRNPYTDSTPKPSTPMPSKPKNPMSGGAFGALLAALISPDRSL